MSDNGQTLQEHREAYIEVVDKAARILRLQDQMAADCERLRAQIQLATESLKSLQTVMRRTRPFWLLLAGLLGGLIGGSLAAMIQILTRV